MESWSGVKFGGDCGVKLGGDFGVEFGVGFFFWWILGVNGLFH